MSYEIAKVDILREIRDTLLRIEAKLEKGVEAKFDANAPTNPYGEGLVVGIQNGIARGLQGIETP